MQPVHLLSVAQAVAAAAVLRRLARGRRRRKPLAWPEGARPLRATVTVVLPARDEAERIGPCLEGLRGEDVIVVDDGSSDGTAEIARSYGARVVQAGPLPEGWLGKPWALQRGLEEASGEVVVSLDADTRPAPGLVAAMAAELEHADLVSAGPRFLTGSAAQEWLHASLLATLVYRFGPADVDGPQPSPARVMANGQCTAVRRERLLAEGGYALAPDRFTDDIALARALARRGWRVRFVDARDVLQVQMHASLPEVWREWGRTIAAADVTPARWQAADLAVVWLVLALPVLRPSRLGFALLALRWAVVAALRGSYARGGPGLWLSPLADPLAATRLTLSTLRPARAWRGRTYR
jgi:dolichol-phosphate mannosyltransferase